MAPFYSLSDNDIDDKVVNIIIETWTKEDSYYDNIAIITPEEGIKRGETNFVRQ